MEVYELLYCFNIMHLLGRGEDTLYNIHMNYVQDNMRGIIT